MSSWQMTHNPLLSPTKNIFSHYSDNHCSFSAFTFTIGPRILSQIVQLCMHFLLPSLQHHWPTCFLYSFFLLFYLIVTFLRPSLQHLMTTTVAPLSLSQNFTFTFANFPFAWVLTNSSDENDQCSSFTFTISPQLFPPIFHLHVLLESWPSEQHLMRTTTVPAKAKLHLPTSLE